MVDLTVEEAEARMADGDHVATCRPHPFMNVVVARPRSEIIETFKRNGVQEAGPNATSEGYGLYTHDEEGRLFVAVKAATRAPRTGGDGGE